MLIKRIAHKVSTWCTEDAEVDDEEGPEVAVDKTGCVSGFPQRMKMMN